MRWVAPPEKDQDTETLESRLWAAADQLRANSGLSTAQYSQPVLGLIFLRFAEARFAEARFNVRREALEGAATRSISRVLQRLMGIDARDTSAAKRLNL